MNRKGFTLIELLGTIIILAVLIGIGAYSITSIINNAKIKDYELLLANIKEASELYHQECNYAKTAVIDCDDDMVSLGELVDYGYLKGNNKYDENSDKIPDNLKGKYTVDNPYDNNNISDCNITITYANGTINVVSNTSNSSCPTSNEYSTGKMDDSRKRITK